VDVTNDSKEVKATVRVVMICCKVASVVNKGA